MGTGSVRYVPDTRIETQTTQAILTRKLVGRMYEEGMIEIRDVYDLAIAERNEPEALEGVIAGSRSRGWRSTFGQTA